LKLSDTKCLKHQGMCVEDVRTLVVPASLAYGARGRTFRDGRSVPPGANIGVEVELLQVVPCVCEHEVCMWVRVHVYTRVYVCALYGVYVCT
jgi:hypothetical protein